MTYNKNAGIILINSNFILKKSKKPIPNLPTNDNRNNANK